MTKPKTKPQQPTDRAQAIAEIRIQLDWVARSGRRHTAGVPVTSPGSHMSIVQRLADEHRITHAAMLAYLVAVVAMTDDQFDAYIDPPASKTAPVAKGWWKTVKAVPPAPAAPRAELTPPAPPSPLEVHEYLFTRYGDKARGTAAKMLQ